MPDKYLNESEEVKEQGSFRFPVIHKKQILIFTLVVILIVFLIVILRILTPSKDQSSMDSGRVPGPSLTPSELTKGFDLIPTRYVNSTNKQEPYFTKPGGDVFATVGDEVIYTADLEKMYGNNPIKGDSVKAMFANKMVEDSIILQAGAQERLILINDRIYNKNGLSYEEREQAVRSVKEALANKTTIYEGKVISVWFWNVEVGRLGFENAKREAFNKISELHAQVKSGRIDIDKAALLIQNDPSYEILDPSYKSNSIFSFSASGSERITLDKEFDSALRDLEVNQVSDIYIGYDAGRDGNKHEALYMFAELTAKKQGLNEDDFENWLNKRKEEYEIRYQ